MAAQNLTIVRQFDARSCLYGVGGKPRCARSPLVLLLMSAALPGVRPAEAGGPTSPSAFSYQGRLLDANSPVEGSRPIVARLFDDPDSGSMVGDELSLDVDFVDGVFTVDLDFGSVFRRDPAMARYRNRRHRTDTAAADPTRAVRHARIRRPVDADHRRRGPDQRQRRRRHQ